MNSEQVKTLATYAEALAGAAPDRVIALLGPAAVFTSPFSSWTEAADVRSAYMARAVAVTGVNVTTSITGGDVGVVRWRGRIGQRFCEGVDIVTVTPTGAVVRADVFVRPAAVLDDLRVAMTAAWPRDLNLPA